MPRVLTIWHWLKIGFNPLWVIHHLSHLQQFIDNQRVIFPPFEIIHHFPPIYIQWCATKWKRTHCISTMCSSSWSIRPLIRSIVHRSLVHLLLHYSVQSSLYALLYALFVQMKQMNQTLMLELFQFVRYLRYQQW